MDWRAAARIALFPARALWATANRLGLINFSVGSSPHLDDVALARWRQAIDISKVYLEYGSGGSTVEAAKSVTHVISVETEGRFLSAVEQAFANSAANAVEFKPIYVDIGWTEMWGRPLIGLPTAARLQSWRRYSSAPWAYLEQYGLVPDFIFVDGRFRVASVLESILRLPTASSCLIMLDDFDQRKAHYGIVIEFAEEVQYVGRAVVFRKRADFNREKCAELLVQYQADPE